MDIKLDSCHGVTVSDSSLEPNEIDKAQLDRALHAPTSTQCTAVDWSGDEITFDPQSPGTPVPTVIDSGEAPRGVACPAATQCTAVDMSGQQLTFDPQTADPPTVTNPASGAALYGVACPTSEQCTAVDYTGHEMTGLIPHPTTTIACSPTSPIVGVAATCTASVSDSGASDTSAPLGSVAFTSSPGSSDFPPSGVCSLAASPER